MAINSDKTYQWKEDVSTSIDFYNDWFLRFAPLTFRKQRAVKTEEVLSAFKSTDNLSHLNVGILLEHPHILPILRMAVAPPIARDRLIGLAYTSKSLVGSMEGTETEPPRIPPRISALERDQHLQKIIDVIVEMLDYELFPWLVGKRRKPKSEELNRGIAVVADRLCGAASDPIIRNAQERRQLETIGKYLTQLGYSAVNTGSFDALLAMPKGSYTFRYNIAVSKGKRAVNIPIDCVISRHNRADDELPILVEAKSAGDATNTNKRRKEEAQKFTQLKHKFGKGIKYVLFLCGYFDPGYLGYEAAEGIDWIWEHRLDDLLKLDLLESKKKAPRELKEACVLYSAEDRSCEGERLKQQQRVDGSKSAFERNQMGQFSTPFVLADQMTEYALPLLTETSGVLKALEPACGSGVFLSALTKQCPNTFSFLGVEVDRAYAEICQKLYKEGDVTVLIEDYFQFQGRQEWNGKFDLLLTNPPYVRHHHIDSLEKVKLQEKVQLLLNIQVSGLSGLYVYYLLLSDQLLKEGAIGSWLVPSEFLYTNYGKALREYLSQHVTLVRIHIFHSDDVQFDDALVSSCIVTYRKTTPSHSDSFDVTTGSYDSPDLLCRRACTSCDPSEKWTFLDAEVSPASEGILLGDLFQVTRGIATGNNDFFILSPEDVASRKIEKSVLLPLIPSPRYVKEPIINADAAGFPLIEKAGYLLSISETPDEVERLYPSAFQYLNEGVEKRVHEGALCKGRKVWYFQERRAPPLYVASYMGRVANARGTAIHFHLNRSKGIVTNGFICLYPKSFLMKLLKGDNARQEELLEALNSITAESFTRGGRNYGGGLQKIEPNELGRIRLSQIPKWLVVSTATQTDLFTVGKTTLYANVCENMCVCDKGE
jgi:hypothetical protein